MDLYEQEFINWVGCFAMRTDHWLCVASSCALRRWDGSRLRGAKSPRLAAATPRQNEELPFSPPISLPTYFIFILVTLLEIILNHRSFTVRERWCVRTFMKRERWWMSCTFANGENVSQFKVIAIYIYDSIKKFFLRLCRKCQAGSKKINIYK